MVTFPNCKINLGLNVISKRNDGYHDLETVFYPVAIRDALEIIQSGNFEFHLSGLPVSGTEDDNLCVKAYRLLKADFPALPSINAHLHKCIPMGAGLGGGSSDGAYMLKLLNKKFHLRLSNEQLTNYALQLGSDCPFFILNTPCFATGRGENLQPVRLDLSAYKLVLVNPGIHVSTKAAFSNLIPAHPEKSIKQIIQQHVETWKTYLMNDFEKSVFKQYEEIGWIKQELYSAGAVYAAMTGTGSTVYGIFKDEQGTFKLPDFPERHKIYMPD